MAKKTKISSHIKERRSYTESFRKIDFRAKRRYFLIVCEGEKTEPNYFESLKNALPKGVLDVYSFRIDGTGYNTESLVKKAIELKTLWESDLERKVDKLWVVFDKDSFKPKAFNNAIQLCLNNHPTVEAAWTNEAFELWYLLHFNFYNTGISRKQYQDLIENNFKKRGLKNYKYKKNSLEMFDLLETFGSREDAIKNAINLEKIYDNTSDFANHNPCTKVHKLVMELFGLNGLLDD
jgi:RloB-like protein